jgi:glycosyltransferase involved in cell wall biosynthesis
MGYPVKSIITITAIPKISVLLPVKNMEKYISEAIDSVLSQTYQDFELLVYDDNSTDYTLDVVESYGDPRIKIYTGTNGFIANLNSGIEQSTGVYIARIDADDKMHHTRLEIQLDIMEHLKVDVCSSWLVVFGERINNYIQDYEGRSGMITNALEQLSKTNYVAHSSVMVRRQFLIDNNLRYLNYPHAEDYKLWSEVAKKGGVFYMEPQALTAYRFSADQISRQNAQEVINQSIRIENEIKEFLQKGH